MGAEVERKRESRARPPRSARRSRSPHGRAGIRAAAARRQSARGAGATARGRKAHDPHSCSRSVSSSAMPPSALYHGPMAMNEAASRSAEFTSEVPRRGARRCRGCGRPRHVRRPCRSAPAAGLHRLPDADRRPRPPLWRLLGPHRLHRASHLRPARRAAALRYRARPCLSAAAIADPPVYDRARAAARYSATMRDLIQSFKYRRPA